MLLPQSIATHKQTDACAGQNCNTYIKNSSRAGLGNAGQFPVKDSGRTTDGYGAGKCGIETTGSPGDGFYT